MTIKLTQSEADIQRAILEYLATRQDVHAFRINCGRFKTKHGTWISGAPTGTSDIVGWVTKRYAVSSIDPLRPEYRQIPCFFACEVKRPGGKPTVPQQAFLDKVTEAGGIALCATSVQDVMDALGEPI